MNQPKSGVTPTQQRKLEHMQKTWDIINAKSGIDSVQICAALGVAKSTGANWIAWLCLDGSVERIRGKRSMRGIEADTFVVIGPRPTVAPEREKPGFIPPESVENRTFTKAKNLGMSADSLALPAEFFNPPSVPA